MVFATSGVLRCYRTKLSLALQRRTTNHQATTVELAGWMSIPRNTLKRSDAAPEADQLQFFRPADVCSLLRISRPTLWRLRRAGQFPAPVSLSKRSIGWRRADVEAWVGSRPNGIEPQNTTKG
jgi:prophage regulatory protein